MNERCSTCARTDFEYANTEATCNDPWHGDAHLRVPKVKKYAVNGRPITLGEPYVGHGPDDPSGTYYTYDDQPGVTHWMSTGAMQVRMKEVE